MDVTNYMRFDGQFRAYCAADSLKRSKFQARTLKSTSPLPLSLPAFATIFPPLPFQTSLSDSTKNSLYEMKIELYV